MKSIRRTIIARVPLRIIARDQRSLKAALVAIRELIQGAGVVCAGDRDFNVKVGKLIIPKQEAQ